MQNLPLKFEIFGNQVGKETFVKENLANLIYRSSEITTVPVNSVNAVQ